MAEWTPLSSFNQLGQPNTSIAGQDRMRVDPRNAYSGFNLPLQETGQAGIVEPDGYGSLPNFTISEDQVAVDQRVASVPKFANDIQSRQSSETRYTYQPPVLSPIQILRRPEASSGLPFPQQSASGFSHRINIPSNGHLWELPPSETFHRTAQEIPLIPNCVAPDNFPQSSSTHESVQRELGQLLGADQYAQRYRECYASHISAGRNSTSANAYATHLLIVSDRNAVMCVLCNYGGEGFPQKITHAPNCPVLQCLQRIANPVRPYQHSDQSNQRGSTWVMANQVLNPRPEQEENDNSNFVEQRPSTPFYTANNWQSGQARNSQILNSNYSSNSGGTLRLDHSSHSELRRPVYQQFASINERYRTFDNLHWTSKQKPKKLAEAGLFYIGFADHCRCFYCGGLLRDWQDGDDPIVEHEKWFPNCRFIQEVLKVHPTAAASTRVQETRFQDVTEVFANLGIHEQGSATLPNHLNPDICAICQRREIAVTQMHCGHIVCRPCLPTPNAEGRYLCRLCGREMVNTAAIDPFCRRSHSQRPF